MTATDLAHVLAGTHPLSMLAAAEAALEHAGIAVLVLNDHLDVLAAHGAVARCMGTPTIVTDVPLFRYVSPPTRAAWQAAHASIVNGSAPHATFTVERTEHGLLISTTFDLAPASAPLGGHRCVVCVGRDITAQRSAEQREQHTMEVVVHQLRTPLTALKGYAQLAFKQIDAAGSGASGRLLQLINEQSDRMAQLLDRWADTVRVRQGQLRLRRSAVDLGALVEDVVGVRRRNASDRVLQVQIDAPPVVVQADRRRVHHAVGLLVDTALNYSPSTSPVHIRVHGTPPAAQVSVRDHGVRIPAAHAQSVWQPDYQSPDDAHRQLGGVGWGLHVVKLIVEHHGGEVSVVPHAGGNVWNIRLPLAS